LDDLTVDPGVLDLGEVNRSTPFYFSDEAHGVYNTHHVTKCQAKSFLHPVDFPVIYIRPDYSV
jgi:hypothetical protein